MVNKRQKSNMKIVLLVNYLTGGGSERVAALWAEGFSNLGFQVTVLLCNDQMPLTYKLPNKVKLGYFASHRKNRVFRVIERIRILHKRLRSEMPDIVIDVEPRFERLIARIGLNTYNVSTEHNSFERPKGAKIELEWFSKFWLNRLYDHVTVLTQADKNVIGNRLRRVTVLPNPLALRPVQSVIPKKKVILAVGRKDDWHYKGFDILIKAWSKICRDAKEWRVQIVGGSTRGGQTYLDNLCLEYGVADRVGFYDYQSDIQQYYQQASIFVLSSRYEGFGLVLIEAMSQACACIACDYKGRQSEIVTNGVDGITCEPDNVDALARALLTLINNEKLRVHLQEKAIQRAADFSVDKIMEKWKEILINHK